MSIVMLLRSTKILISIVEQVSDMISDSKIPDTDQPEINQAMDAAIEKLNHAKKCIDIDPK